MSLPGLIEVGVRRIESLIGEDADQINALREIEMQRKEGPRDEVLCALTAMRVTRVCVKAEIASVHTALAAMRANGAMPRELIAADMDPMRGKMLASLHRAGDHTMDEEGEE